MSTIKITSTTGVDFDHYDLPNPGLAVKNTHTPTKWHLDYSPGIFDEYVGKGLQYDVNNDLTTGTINSFTFVESKTEKFTVTGLTLDAGVLTGAPDGNDFLSQALAGSDTITGGNGNDHILGFAGFDTIDGGKGADTMEGGADSNSYVIDNIGDTVIEKAGGGDFDAVKIGINSITAPIAEVEIYTYTGKGNWSFTATTFAVQVTGGAGNDVLTGSAGSDTLNGGKGIDTLEGGLGNDSYNVNNLAELAKIKDTGGTDLLITTVAPTAVADIENYNFIGKTNWTFTASDGVNHSLSGGSAIDTLTGGNGDDTISGHNGNDILSGGIGADKMIGGSGNDTYTIDNAGDTILEFAKEGIDTVKSVLDVDLVKDAAFLIDKDIENVVLLTGALKATGNTLNNVLTGNDAANTLDGAAGNDTLIGGLGDDSLKGGTGKDAMTGGAGNDTYFIDDAGDKVTEKAGEGDHDKLVSDILLKAVVANVEDYQYTGAAAWTFTGGKTDNAITGGTGNDTLAGGGGGKDTFAGGLGNDTYTIDADDTVTEGVGAGTDTVKIADPGITAIANVENYIFTGKGAWTFTANALDNVVQGGKGSDTLDGGAGEDTAVFTGKYADYQISFSGTDIVVKGKADGTDTLSNFEHLKFADRSVETLNILGEKAGDALGVGVSLAGDVNGDGFLDIVIGASGANSNGNNSGSAYVLFGRAAGGFAETSLADLNGSNGFELKGAASNDGLGQVAGIGDINDDGFDDILVGARSADSPGANSGAAYVVFGHSGGFAAEINLGTLKSAEGFLISGGAANDQLGYTVAPAGDLNGDGFADFVVGGHSNAPNYVIFGHTGTSFGTIDVGLLDGTTGFQAGGENHLGHHVIAAGDINGDGFDDLIAGETHLAYGTPDDYGVPIVGGGFILFGTDKGFAAVEDVSQIDGKNGFMFIGDEARNAGTSVAAAGDVNGDGFADFIVGSPRLGINGIGGVAQGGAYVVFGHDGDFDLVLDMTKLDGTNGFKLTGNLADYAGRPVSAAGDVNGDGIDDIMVNGWQLSAGEAGVVYVVYGHEGKFSNVDLAHLTPTQGLVLHGANDGDSFGWAASPIGDIDGDGFDDLLIGAAGSDSNGADSGSAIVYFGGTSSTAVQIHGTDDADTLTGTTAANVIIGENGNDTLNGAGGNDLLYGGEGKDAIHVTSNTFVRVDGGDGVNTLFLDYKGAIDFGNIDAKATTSEHSKMANLEVLNFDNGQVNAVTLHLADVISIEEPGVLLKLEGNAGDTLKLFSADGWATDTAIVGYNVFDNGGIKIAVDTDIVATVT